MQRPDRKVRHATIAGAITTVIIFVLGEMGIEVPGEVGSAITGLATLLVAYISKPSAQDSSNYIETAP